MRKMILVSAAMVILALSEACFAAQVVFMNPFTAIKNDINELDTQVSLLQGQINGLQLQINATLPAVQMPAFNTFLFIDGIPGEINDPNDPAHTGWIRVQSFNWAVSLSQSSVGGGVSSPELGNFVIIHPVDKASVKLCEACCKGTHIPEVTLELWRTTGNKAKYMVYKLRDVFVASVKPAGNVMSDGIPMEQVSFNFEKIEWTYIASDGNLVTAGWDIVKGGAL
jgi:type VI secretion system secreted protein Hcp